MAVVTLALTDPTASAHTGIGNTSGFLDGLAHSFSGSNHILATTMMGLFASLLGRRAF
ncbi:HupE/UreJ family protein [Microbaculum sp. FT89]|uniref:HupE/UreJ family protein n=1 Tax=Microbaculum sp. FT89 TaxID=3447298 RepID=UPI003F534DB0